MNVLNHVVADKYMINYWLLIVDAYMNINKQIEILKWISKIILQFQIVFINIILF